eukprot:6177824-Pleurochrysis_carterae.AAC.1
MSPACTKAVLPTAAITGHSDILQARGEPSRSTATRSLPNAVINFVWKLIHVSNQIKVLVVAKQCDGGSTSLGGLELERTQQLQSLWLLHATVKKVAHRHENGLASCTVRRGCLPGDYKHPTKRGSKGVIERALANGDQEEAESTSDTEHDGL